MAYGESNGHVTLEPNISKTADRDFVPKNHQ